MNHFKFQLLSSCAMAPDGPSGGGSSSGASGVASSGGGSTSTSSAPSTPASSPGPDSSSSTPSGASSSEGGSAAPPAAAPAPDASPAPLDADMWAGFDLDSTEDQLASTAEPAPAPAAPKDPAQVQTPQAPEPPAAAQQQEPPAQPQQAQPGPQDVAGQQAPQQPQIPTPAEPAKMGQAILASIEDLADHLAKTPEFALSEAEIEALNTDFASALPKLGAKMYLRAQASALAQMERVVPAIIQRYMKVDAARQTSQKTFYQRWPQIDQTKHSDLVDRMARSYRAENPNATLAQMVEDLGPFVMMAARIDPNSAHQQAAPNGGRAPAVPPTARPAGNGRTPPPSPFVPAVGGAAAQPTTPSADPWGGYGAAEEE